MVDNKNKGKKKSKLNWRSWHKWVGMVFSVFILVFCFSGIILNHRQLFSSCEVSRWWLPSAYHINNWNQSVVKGTLPVKGGKLSGKIIAFGQTGVWVTDRNFKNWQELNNGITEGIDNRKITDVVQTSDGKLWCSGLYDAYCLNTATNSWEKIVLPDNSERISDIALRGGDTIAVITRSTLYEAAAPSYKFTQHKLKTPAGFDNKVTLFKVFWMLHSGDLFGLIGRLVVDFIAVVIIILCITGMVFFVLSYSVKHTNKQIRAKVVADIDSAKNKIKTQAGWMRWNLKWHNRFGAWLIVLTLLLSVTGMCLRPPLMVPLVLTHVAPVPGSTLASSNAFNDKLRGIRWDEKLNEWILATSAGFYSLDEKFEKAPVAMKGSPEVSPMGINVFCRNPKNSSEWLVGSFSGLVSWNPGTGKQTDWFTGKAPEKPKGMPIASHAVTGWTADLSCTNGTPAVFEYSAEPNVKMPEMPETLKEQPMSLWNFALELHVGRCYEPFLGSVLSILFVFISGLLLTLTLVSGYIIYKRTHK